MANQQSHLRARFSLDDSAFQMGIGRVSVGVESLRRSVMGLGAAAAGLRLLQVAITGVSLALGAPVSKAAQFEDATIGFEQLLGSAQKAKERIEELQRFSATTPFELPGVIRASTVLETLTHGALSVGEGLRMVGDAAAQTGEPVEELSVWFGRLYDGMMTGRPEGRALMRMQELGIVSGDLRNKLEKMQAQGMKGAKVWHEVEQAMGRFSGLMEKRSATWNGKISNLSDAWGILMVKIGMPIKDALTPFLDTVILAVNQLMGSGTGFGESIVRAGTAFGNTIMGVLGAFQSIPNWFALASALFKVAILSTLVQMQANLGRVMGLWANAMDLIMGSGLLKQLHAAGQFFGTVFAAAMASGLPRLWEGLRAVVSGLEAALIFSFGKTVGFFASAITKTVDFFSGNWFSAIVDPLKTFAGKMAAIGSAFGASLKEFFTTGKTNFDSVVNSAKAVTGENKSQESEAKLFNFMASMGVLVNGTLKEHYDRAQERYSKFNPYSDMEGQKAAGDQALLAAMNVVKKAAIENVIEPLKKFFNADEGSLMKAKDKSIEQLKAVIASLAPEGKRAVAAAISKMFVKPGNTDGRDPRWNGWKTYSGSNLLDIGRTPGVSTGGLATGGLLNPQIRRAQEIEQSRQREANRTKVATEATAVEMKDALLNLFGLHKEVWTKP